VLKGQVKGHMRKTLGAIPCYEAWHGLSVTPEGNISICGPYASRSPLRVQESGCQVVWDGEHAEGVRKMMVTGDISGLRKECCTNRLFENRRIREQLADIPIRQPRPPFARTLQRLAA